MRRINIHFLSHWDSGTPMRFFIFIKLSWKPCKMDFIPFNLGQSWGSKRLGNGFQVTQTLSGSVGIGRWWMAPLTQWTWIWGNSGRWWRTGKPGVLQSMGWQESDTIEWLNNKFDSQIHILQDIMFFSKMDLKFGLLLMCVSELKGSTVTKPKTNCKNKPLVSLFDSYSRMSHKRSRQKQEEKLTWVPDVPSTSLRCWGTPVEFPPLEFRVL